MTDGADVTPERLFFVCNALALPGWILLVFAPRWKYSARLIAPVIIPGLLGIVYAYLVLSNIDSGGGNFGTLNGVAQAFENPHILLAGWIHYLAFDLFVGSWIARDAQKLGLRHILIAPSIVLTFLLGPVGLAWYLALRWYYARSLVLVAAGDMRSQSPAKENNPSS